MNKLIGFLFVLWPAWVMADACLDDSSDKPLPQINLKEVASGFVHPVHLSHAGDNSHRLYIVEQAGTIKIIEQGKTLTNPFLDIRDRVASGGEKGLLSVAFHPDYVENGYLYVNYTSKPLLGKLHTRISRFKRASKLQADPDSEKVLLEIDQPYGNHNGGQIAFGPDGFLYIGMGDGGSAYDPLKHGQNPSTLLGAILRINVDKATSGRAYSVPDDNPFVDKPGFRAEIWAYGFRNPWRFSFDEETGRLLVADVGQDRIEEINDVIKGGNYGWHIMEGAVCTQGDDAECDKQGLLDPIYTYRHPEGFSITGGFVYRGSDIPALCGAYIFADYVTNKIWGLRYNGKRVISDRLLLKTKINISSFGQDQKNALYVLGHQSGKLHKIVADR